MKAKLALIQMLSTANKQQNLTNAKKLLKKAASTGSNILVLPECFNSPYGTQFFSQYAEPLHGETSAFLKQVSIETQSILVGGSFPELYNNKFFNTCTVWDNGELIGVHRKIHLFDINIPGKQVFKESEVLSGGDCITILSTRFGKIGVGICYDLRFPEVATIASNEGCTLMIYPGAFNLTTGPLHWELLLRARAVDNQLFVVGCSPATDKNASYVAYGNSLVVDPMGKLGDNEDILEVEIDFGQIESTRQMIPIRSQKRWDVYSQTKKAGE